jgi:hypothetical protein
MQLGFQRNKTSFLQSYFTGLCCFSLSYTMCAWKTVVSQQTSLTPCELVTQLLLS